MLIDAGIDSSDARIEVSEFFECAKTEADFIEFINRRVSGEPMAYITGSKPFYKSEFKVIPGVLIPRSDTEILVETALRFLRCLNFPMGDIYNVPETNISHINDGIKVVDLCTGTGCVGISIHKELLENQRNASTILVDISDEALACSASNVDGLNNIDIIKADVLDTNSLVSKLGETKADIIVSNPPYINSEDMKLLDKTVGEFEPHLALFGGEDGMDFYSALADTALAILKNGGAIAVEHGYDQGEKVRKVFSDHGLKSVMTIKDYGDNDRVTFGIKE